MHLLQPLEVPAKPSGLHSNLRCQTLLRHEPHGAHAEVKGRIIVTNNASSGMHLLGISRASLAQKRAKELTCSALDVHMWFTLPSIVWARATAFDDPVAMSSTSRASMTVPTPTVSAFFGTFANIKRKRVIKSKARESKKVF